MTRMQLLLISNSTNPGEAYLDYPKQNIKAFLSKYKVEKVLFIPYAAVTFSYDEYLRKVQSRFSEIGIEVIGIHQTKDPVNAVKEAQALVVGGGNTFSLLKKVQELKLIEVIRARVEAGMPYVGWSAGSNMACPTIRTTNDMPIVEPLSFNSLNLIPFQINPHYLDTHPLGHGGETREQRILEYLEANPNSYVVGLRERCMLLVENNKLILVGPNTIRLFKKGQEAKELSSSEDLNFLMEK